MKIYKKKTIISREINSQTIADDYSAYIDEIAECINKLSDITDRVKYLHEVTEDNGDVGFQLDDALLKLGLALAIACSYKKEYQEEADEHEAEND